MGNIVNSVQLIGNLGDDPEAIYMDSGRVKATMSIATSEVWYTKDNKKQVHTDWHNVVAWDRKAEAIEKYCRKGTRVLIDGKLRAETWKDKEGVTRSKTLVLVNEFLVLDAREEKKE